MAGIGPAPFAAMLLADLGAEVIRIEGRKDPPGTALPRKFNLVLRGRPAISINLKDPSGLREALRIVDAADVLIEGWRPGVAERLGIGPAVCSERNPKLIYARMTGWGQSGPMASAPGHDIDYVALSGVLHMCGSADAPSPPLNLLGDYGGGLLMAFGVMAALWEVNRSGRGQVVDAAMVDGAALLSTVFHGLLEGGLWSDTRGVNLLDGGAPYYGVYETLDGRFVAVGAVEPKFQSDLAARIGVRQASGSDPVWPAASWPSGREQLAGLFRTRTRDEWCELLEGTGACFAPVLSPREAPSHPHNVSRQTFVEIDGIPQPAPAPRFSRTPPSVPLGPTSAGSGRALLRGWGLPDVAAVDL
jgi:alpha-methylacyl-CoA racemase